MPISYTHERYTPELLRNNSKSIFVFGDNLQQVGHGGQAIIRDEPNTLGIPTKVNPSNGQFDFFTDENFVRTGGKKCVDNALYTMEEHLKNTVTVVIPYDFIGTGLAKLWETSPFAFWYINHRVNILMHQYGVSKNDD